MGEFKGTKGIWSFKEFNDSRIKYRFYINSANGVSVCKILRDDNDDSSEERHNALLISKAPELLSMLQKISDFIDDNEKINYKIRLLSREVSNIKELIKSATEL